MAATTKTQLLADMAAQATLIAGLKASLQQLTAHFEQAQRACVEHSAANFALAAELEHAHNEERRLEAEIAALKAAKPTAGRWRVVPATAKSAEEIARHDAYVAKCAAAKAAAMAGGASVVVK